MVETVLIGLFATGAILATGLILFLAGFGLWSLNVFRRPTKVILPRHLQPAATDLPASQDRE